MAERLDNIAYQQSSGGRHHASSNFNPRSVSVDIRTPEELAAVNEFLITLGRDVSGRPQSSSSPHSNSFPSDPYFDPANLSQLGLTGMPGLPGSNSNFSEYSQYSSSGPNYHPSRSNHSSVQPNQFNTMYSAMNEPPMGYNDYNGRRQPSKYPASNSSFSNQHYHHPTPPLESGSPHSTVSTPVTTTPPQVPMSMPDNFDYLRPSRGAPTVAHLAPPEYIGKSMRPMIPLKSLPSAGPSHLPEHPLPVEPKLPLALHRKAASSTTPLSKPGSLYPSLVTGDIQFKLPPLNKMYRSPSPPSPSRESSPSSSAHSSPRAQPTTLPGISSIAGGPLSPDSEALTHNIGRIEIDRTRDSIPQDERKRHAELILNLLVTINNDFKNRFSNEPRDVEMAAV
ncbi:hypothetical protein M413DRAFT_209936 [Hebeloma cylindrosporum]|uniref:Uncharacterized protein n=1 Tax=Hebeloma cylindrosporum TaxID=76867 RepID=A0A0C2YDC2_HEBCY|nr:hypothetical protein M413DRAFT_209936 [Hebeloma cylindrosporum h7]